MELDNIMRWLKENIFKYPNVIGYSMRLEPRERQGKLIEGELCIRILVSKKVASEILRASEIIPVVLFDIPTDIVERGTITAPPVWTKPARVKITAVDKTVAFRPLELGVSVGHWDITAGSLGMLYTKDGKQYLGSNAHVLTPNASMDPSEVLEQRILQPGAYHAGQQPANVVGKYHWHKTVLPFGAPSDCPISNFSISVLNALSKLFQRNSRFSTIIQLGNKIDFGVFEPIIETNLKVADDSIDLNAVHFIGHLFAGSNISGVICKASHIVSEGYMPAIPWKEVNAGDDVKGVSFWCNYQTKVLEPSSAITVNYGDFTALFEDVITVENTNVIKGGWSGSGWFKL